MFHSIRTKFLASHTLVIVLCLAFAGLGAVVLVNRYQREATLRRQLTAAAAITVQIQGLLSLRVGLEQIASSVSREVERLGMRALLVQSDGAVLVDTQEDSKLEGLTQYRAPRGKGFHPWVTKRPSLLGGAFSASRFSTRAWAAAPVPSSQECR
jgi:hypothetical protein